MRLSCRVIQKTKYLFKFNEFLIVKTSILSIIINIEIQSPSISNVSLLWAFVSESKNLKDFFFSIARNQLSLPDFLISYSSQCWIESVIAQRIPFLLSKQSHATVKMIRTSKIQHSIAELFSWIEFYLFQKLISSIYINSSMRI